MSDQTSGDPASALMNISWLARNTSGTVTAEIVRTFRDRINGSDPKIGSNISGTTSELQIEWSPNSGNVYNWVAKVTDYSTPTVTITQL